jgi:hypothetical protein
MSEAVTVIQVQSFASELELAVTVAFGRTEAARQ